MKKKIGVIVPVYNAEKYVEVCLKSIINQTVPFDQIIIIDDGSSDNSTMICEKIASENNNIILKRQANLGVAIARNVAMRLLKTDYVIFVDADDMVRKDTNSFLLKKINENSVDILYYSSDIVKDSSMDVSISKYEYIRSNELCDITTSGFTSLKKIFPNEFIMSACMSAFKVSFLRNNNISFLEGNLFEDRMFSLRTITESSSVTYIRDALYIRRFRENSTSTSKASDKKINNAFCTLKCEWKYIRNNVLWKEEKKLSWSFALFGIQMYLNPYVNTYKNLEIDQQVYELFKRIWWNEMVLTDLDLNDLVCLLDIMNRASKIENLWKTEEVERTRYQLIQKIREWLEKYYCKDGLIAVYGMGNHTDCLHKLINEIGFVTDCTVYYILSMPSNVINTVVVNNIDSDLIEKTSCFIISSKIYQKEMYERLKQQGVPETKIKRLYSSNDGIDVVKMFHVLIGDTE